MGDLVIKLYWEHVNHRLHVCSAVSPPASRYRARNIKQSAQKMIVFSTNFLFPPSLSVPRSRAGPRLPLPASLQSSRPSPRYKYFWNLKIFFWFSRASLNTKRPFMQWRVERPRPRASQLMLLIKLRFYNWIITNSIRSHEHSRNFWPAIILPDLVNYTIYLAHKVSRNVLPTNCTTYAGCVCHRSHHGAWTGQNKTKD